MKHNRMYRSVWLTSTLLISSFLVLGFYALVQQSHFHTLADQPHPAGQATNAEHSQPLFLFTLPKQSPYSLAEQASLTPLHQRTDIWPELSPLDQQGLTRLETDDDVNDDVWVGTASQLYGQLTFILISDLLPALIILMALFTLFGLNHNHLHYGFNSLFSGVLILSVLWVAAGSRLMGPALAANTADLLAMEHLSAKELQRLLLLAISAATGWYLYIQCFIKHPWRRSLLCLCVIQSLSGLFVFALHLKGSHLTLEPGFNQFIAGGVLLGNVCFVTSLVLGRHKNMQVTRLVGTVLPIFGYSLALVSIELPFPGHRGIALLLAVSLLLASLNSVRFQVLHHRRELNKLLEVQLAEKTADLETNNKALQKIKYDLQVANLELKALSFTDALTGAFNRLYFDRQFLSEWQRARREQEPLSLILVDIDNFKELNDTYGHITGDEGLKLVTDILRKGFMRGNDIVCRYGGEEFVILLPNTPPQQAQIRAEKLRAAIEMSPVIFEDHTIPLTASFGVGGLVPQPDHEPLDLLHATDQALYWVKRNGRNGVHVTEAFQTSGEIRPAELSDA